MPLNAQKNKVDAWVGARLPAFRNTQTWWLGKNGQYFQGLITHTTRPNNGAETAPDKLNSHPTDQAEDWTTFLAGDPANGVPPINLPASLPAALIFNVYEGPLGWGWECRSEFDWAGLRYSKVWNTGPESGREADWIETDPNTQP